MPLKGQPLTLLRLAAGAPKTPVFMNEFILDTELLIALSLAKTTEEINTIIENFKNQAK